MVNRKRTERQTTFYKTLHRKPKIEQHEFHQNPRMNAYAPEGKQFLLHQFHPSCYSSYKALLDCKVFDIFIKYSIHKKYIM